MFANKIRLLPNEARDLFTEETGFSFTQHCIMVCQRGSQVYGTSTELSDEDYFAVIIPPIEKLVGLSIFDNWTYQHDDVDVVVFSLRKYIGLLLNSNPTMLETLWYRDGDYCDLETTTAFEAVKRNRYLFSSILAAGSFSGYARNQLERMEHNVTSRRMGAKRKRIMAKFGYDTKNASHLVRLYRMGVEFVETGELTVYRPDREELLAIKNGEWTLEQVKEEAARLEEKMCAAKENSPLPTEPNTHVAESLLVNLTLEHIRHQDSSHKDSRDINPYKLTT